MSRLLSKGMSNIILKGTIEKKWRNQNSHFQSLKSSSQTHADIIDVSDFLLQLKKQRPGSKTVCGFCIIFILKGIITF